MPNRARLTQTRIAASLGITQARVSQLVAKGMPQTTIGEVRAWLKRDPKKRAPTNAKPKARDPKKRAPAIPDPERAGKKGRGRPTEAEKVKSRRKMKTPAATGDDLLDAYRNAVAIERHAYSLAQEAMCDRDQSRISIQIGIHSKASEAMYKAEARYREGRQRRGELISVHEASELYRKGFDFLMRRLQSMSQNIAINANPEKPIVAHDVISKEVNAIISEAQKLYSGRRR